MGGLSIWHILILAAVALLLFGGKGKISDMMGDFGKGVNSFKKGLSDGGKEDPRVINGALVASRAASSSGLGEITAGYARWPARARRRRAQRCR